MTGQIGLNPVGGSDEPLLRGRHGSHRSTLRQSILRIGDIEGHHGSRPYNILMDTIIFAVTLLEITVVIYLAYSHFSHSGESLVALSTLLPILMYFIGSVVHLSDPDERKELEMAGSSKWSTDLLQFPILGPVLTALKVAAVSWGCSSHNNYERLEASAIKLRQAGAFFGAAPEALVQLTVLYLFPKSAQITELNFDEKLEIFAVVLFVITLAESNCYNVLSEYYPMFSRKKTGWRLGNVVLWQKIVLFLHTFFSVASRVVASAALKAAIVYVWSQRSFPLMLIVIVMAEVTIRLVLLYILRQARFCCRGEPVPSSCYESISYAWRATFLSFDFQSSNIFTQIIFYVENIACFVAWAISAHNYGEPWIRDMIYVPNFVVFCSCTGLSLSWLLICHFFGLIKLHGACS